MRTTITFDPDVGAAIDELRRRTNRGISETVNQLIRRALATDVPRRPFAQRTGPVGLNIDVSNVADALGNLEGSESR